MGEPAQLALCLHWLPGCHCRLDLLGRYTDHRPEAAACRQVQSLSPIGKETHYFFLPLIFLDGAAHLVCQGRVKRDPFFLLFKYIARYLCLNAARSRGRICAEVGAALAESMADEKCVSLNVDRRFQSNLRIPIEAGH